MSNKKAQINKVFVYILSIMIVLFVGFLVVKFIIIFTNDSEKIAEVKFFETIKNDYNSVYKTYGALKNYDYRVSSEVKNIYLINQDLSCVDLIHQEDSQVLFNAGDNVLIFGKDGIISSSKIGNFEGECLKILPKNNRFSLTFENIKNKVHITKETN